MSRHITSERTIRRAARIDANQGAVVDILRRVGASVVSLAPMGSGVPDLLVGHRGVNVLMEVKDGSKVPSRRRLTPDEAWFHEHWRGQVAVVETLADALKLIGVVPQEH